MRRSLLALLRCRRGSVAFATVAAMIPTIGVVALGAEAGSWYVTKQHAQNAADAAATSGALRLACALGAVNNCTEPTSACTDTASCVVYRGKEFAAQNTFCNAGATSASYPGGQCTSLQSGTSQSVTIELGSYNGAWAGGAANPNAVRATISQTQPGYLAQVLGLSTVTIGAVAIAKVANPTQPLCALGLGRVPPNSNIDLTLGGNQQLTGNGCGLMSDGAVKYASAPSFSGSGWAVYAASGCTNSGSCDPGVPYNYYMPPATNPLQGLDSASFNSTTGKTTKPCGGSCGTTTLTPNTPTSAYDNLTVTTGDTVTFSPGTYFFYNAAIKINGGTVQVGATTTGGVSGVNIVLLGDSSISITGGTVSLFPNTNNTTYPSLDGVLFDDQAPNKSNNAVTINGSGTVALGGTMYFPNVDVTWGGTTANTNTTCTEVIANSLTISGGAYLSSLGCAGGTIPQSQVVELVQ